MSAVTVSTGPTRSRPVTRATKVAPSRAERKAVTIYWPPDLAKRVKIRAVKDETSLSAITEAAMRAWLAVGA